MYSEEKKTCEKLKATITLVPQKIPSLKLLSDIGFYELKLKAKCISFPLHVTTPMPFSNVDKPLY